MDDQFKAFKELIKRLRAPGGCPWDRKQTYQTLTPYIIEEAYELVDAIESKDYQAMCEELGDIFLHVVMISNMAEEEELFNISDVISQVSEKMITRHPHVFADTKVDSIKDVLQNWERIKVTEKQKKEKATQLSLLSDIPVHFPSLLQAHKIQKKVSRVGFDWPDVNGAVEKVHEEVKELEEVYQAQSAENKTHSSDKEKLEEELGDILFSLVNVARKMNIDPELALRKSNRKFIQRFQKLESHAKEQDKEIEQMSIDELDELWNIAKTS
ncbi:nucleoside triphosphate pyrophosphohydrolase [Thermoproteota archaeon]